MEGRGAWPIAPLRVGLTGCFIVGMLSDKACSVNVFNTKAKQPLRAADLGPGSSFIKTETSKKFITSPRPDFVENPRLQMPVV
jgi:hypothetical protein